MPFAKFSLRHPALFGRAAAFALFASAAAAGLNAAGLSAQELSAQELSAQELGATAAENGVRTHSAAVLTASAEPALSLFSPASSDVAYSSSVGAGETAAAENFIPSASSELQPPPRRGGYGRPRYSDNSHNPDGSNKYTFEAGVGLTEPIGITHKYNDYSYAYQVGFGRNFNKKFATLIEFDWDNFGLQASNLTNQSNFYFGTTGVGLDGNTHVWSFSLDPVYTFYDGEKLGAYVVGGVGFFHKVTTFTVPQQAQVCYYYCGYVTENAAFDHYTSNAPGFDAGFGLTYKPSRFANERFFVEARGVYVDNQFKHGISPYSTSAQVSAYTGTNFYPANSDHTTYIPIKFGLRF